MSKNLSELSGRKGLEDNLFDRYGQLTVDRGTPDKDSLSKLAEDFLIGAANTYGAVTFYDFLKPENKNKKIYLCNGSVCTCAGTQEPLKDKLLDHFEEEEIGEMCCLGRCHENSAFHFQGKNYSGPLNGELAGILKNSLQVKDKYKVGSIGEPILTSEQIDIPKYRLLTEQLFSWDKDALLQEIKTS